MPSDWIKMRTDLYRDPKVCLMADFLMNSEGLFSAHVLRVTGRNSNVTRNALRNVTVGALVTVWGVTRHRGRRVDDDLLVKGIMLSVIDDLCEIPGFGEAMQSVGWAKQTKEGVVFPRFFEEFNVEPNTEALAKAADRQKKYREKRNAQRNALRNGDVTSQSNARVEESREEKSKENTEHGEPKTNGARIAPPAEENAKTRTPKRAMSYSPEFLEFWAAYPKYRRSGKGAAWRAWLIAMRTTEAQTLIEQAEVYATSPKGSGEFSKMPATWLTQRCWEDDPTAWGNPPKKKQHVETSEEINAPGYRYDPHAKD